MNYLLIITAGLLPVIILFFYIYKKDPQPEPTTPLIKAVLLGIIICFLVVFVEEFILLTLFNITGGTTSLLNAPILAFFVAAIPEESFKLLALWLILRRNPYFDEHFDGIVYAVCIGLGFAGIENIFYLFDNIDTWQSIAIGRSFFAVPGHYAFAVIMGYYYSKHHFIDHSPRTAAYTLLIPVLAHGIYDTITFTTGTANPYINSICVLVLIYFCIKMHKFAYKKIIAQLEQDKKDSTT